MSVISASQPTVPLCHSPKSDKIVKNIYICAHRMTYCDRKGVTKETIIMIVIISNNGFHTHKDVFCSNAK